MVNNDLRIKMAEAHGWTDITDTSQGLSGIPPYGRVKREPLPRPQEWAFTGPLLDGLAARSPMDVHSGSVNCCFVSALEIGRSGIAETGNTIQEAIWLAWLEALARGWVEAKK